MVVVMCFIVSCSSIENEKIEAVIDRTSIPKLRATEITTIISDSGITRYRISTPQWDLYDKSAKPYWEFPMGIYCETFDHNLKVESNIRSNYAKFLNNEQLWELKGEVKMMNIKGELFETEHLFWNQRNEKLYSDSLVKITQKTHILNVLGFESNQQMTRYKFRKTTGIFPVEDN